MYFFVREKTEGKCVKNQEKKAVCDVKSVGILGNLKIMLDVKEKKCYFKGQKQNLQKSTLFCKSVRGAEA